MIRKNSIVATNGIGEDQKGSSLQPRGFVQKRQKAGLTLYHKGARTTRRVVREAS